MSEMKDLEIRFSAMEKRLADLERIVFRTGTEPAPSAIKELSVKEFILVKRPSNDVEKTLAIAYFLERFAGMTSFNIDDLAQHFQLAKEAIPTNINDKVNLSIKKGHVAEAKGKKNKKKAWIVTNSGEKFVENSMGK
jgi:hypothetical protein